LTAAIGHTIVVDVGELPFEDLSVVDDAVVVAIGFPFHVVRGVSGSATYWHWP
jgi:hypothetical protein